MQVCLLFENAHGGGWTLDQFGLCILNYFERISQKIPEGDFHILRKHIPSTEHPDFSQSTKKLANITLSNIPIEAFTQIPYHADFANKFIGGGVLDGGCVQEEILFVIKPECLASLLFCEVMNKDEAIIISGAEMFSNYSGYGHGMKFAGNHLDTTPFNQQLNCIDNHIVGIDALVNRGKNQFEADNVLRDVAKLFVALDKGLNGASLPNNIPYQFVTGHWGCGAFGGDKDLKAIQQWIAVSEAEFSVVYSYFSEKAFAKRFHLFLSSLYEQNIKVGQLYNSLLKYENLSKNNNLFDFLLQDLAISECSTPLDLFIAEDPSKL